MPCRVSLKGRFLVSAAIWLKVEGSQVDGCREAINDFMFGLYEEEQDGEMVGRNSV